ncbi:MAG: carboxypeptidase-like regulatory domain-containing protein [Bacteroidia bacterium]|nr:carboxypeptidase-like regulatory domain-containing protein [Bacteroidia bacterium]
MKNTFLFYFTLYTAFLTALKTEAQDILLKGSVKDSLTREPIAGAILTIKQHPQGLILQFGETNNKGYFEIAAPKKPNLTLDIALLGYKTRSYYIDTTKTTQYFDVTLISTSINLKETIVIENKPQAEKDTLEYRLKDLIQAGDKNIEDVIKKIPGVEIDQKGKITHNGKPISRILIDGDDIKGSNYQKITKVLPAQAVDTIQIIDKYSDNPLLAKIESTDEKILNLKLNAKSRNVWIGDYTLSLGVDANYQPRYTAKAEQMLFRKKFKNYSFWSY